MKRRSMVLLLTAIVTGLMAGLFFSWSVSVIPGLLRVDDVSYVSTMQAINRAIQNPVFFTCFFGAAILLPISTYLHYASSPGVAFWLLLAASIAYLGGVMGVTIAGNVPMNDALDAFDLRSATAEQISLQRLAFQSRWNNLNSIRTVSNISALVLVLLAIFAKQGQKTF